MSPDDHIFTIVDYSISVAIHLISVATYFFHVIMLCYSQSGPQTGTGHNRSVGQEWVSIADTVWWEGQSFR